MKGIKGVSRETNVGGRGKESDRVRRQRCVEEKNRGKGARKTEKKLRFE